MLEGRVRCTKSADPSIFKCGKVYNFIDGRTMLEYGELSSNYNDITHLNITNRGFYFVEIGGSQYELFLEMLGLKIGDRIVSSHTSYNPCTITENGILNSRRENSNELLESLIFESDSYRILSEKELMVLLKLRIEIEESLFALEAFFADKS